MHHASNQQVPVKKLDPRRPRRSMIRRILHAVFHTVQTCYRIARISVSVIFFLLGAGLLFLLSAGIYILLERPVKPPVRLRPRSGNLAPGAAPEAPASHYLYFQQPKVPRQALPAKTRRHRPDTGRKTSR